MIRIPAFTTVVALLPVLPATTLTGCGSDSGSSDALSDSTCALRVTLSGAADVTQGADREVGCGVQHSFDDGIDTVFLPVTELTAFAVEIAGVTEGQVGAGFPTQLSVDLEDGRRFRAENTVCSVEVTEHRLENVEASTIGEQRHYQVSGAGSCSGPALPIGGGAEGELVIGPFSFRVPVVWRD